MQFGSEFVVRNETGRVARVGVEEQNDHRGKNHVRIIARAEGTSMVPRVRGSPSPSVTIAPIPAGQFATYTFRVRGVGANDATSAPSNEITVGPPPTGFHGAATRPTSLKEPGQFTPDLAMALDDNGDPAFVYTVMDPNNDQDASDSRVDFVSWSRATYRWNAPVTIEVTGDITSRGAVVPVSFAADASTHRFGVAYLVAPKT